MKLNKLSFFVVALIFILGACTEPDNLVPTNTDWDGEQFPVGGGLLEVTTPSVNYIVGEPEGYKVEFEVKQGANNHTKKVEVYSVFHAYKRAGEADTLVLDEDGNKIPLSSNEVLLKSFDITEATNHFIDFDLNYSDLIKDLEIDGAALPASDGELSIGDYWELRFVSTVEDGNKFENYKRTNISVSTRFAGTYITTSSSYIHPTSGNLGDWNGLTKYVESVDAITYKLTYIGSWESEANNALYFTVNEDYSITVLTEYGGVEMLIWGADPVATCQDGTLPSIDCENTNFVELKDDGKDVIHIAYGYIRSSGTREFEETMVKQ